MSSSSVKVPLYIWRAYSQDFFTGRWTARRALILTFFFFYFFKKEKKEIIIIIGRRRRVFTSCESMLYIACEKILWKTSCERKMVPYAFFCVCVDFSLSTNFFVHTLFFTRFSSHAVSADLLWRHLSIHTVFHMTYVWRFLWFVKAEIRVV